MNDTERELRELLDRKASEARIAPVPPAAVLKRGRRRQFGTALLAAGTTLVVVVGSILGVQGILRGNDTNTQQPASTQPVTTRRAVIQGLTVTSPSDWTLIDEWPLALTIGTSSVASSTCTQEPGQPPPGCPTPQSDVTPTSVPTGLPVIQLSNFDTGLATSLCGAGTMPAGSAALYVAIDIDQKQGVSSVTFPSSLDVSGAPQDGPCGPGAYASFTSGDYPYFAFAATGA